MPKRDKAYIDYSYIPKFDIIFLNIIYIDDTTYNSLMHILVHLCHVYVW